MKRPHARRIHADECERLESQMCGLLSHLHHKSIPHLYDRSQLEQILDVGQTAIFVVIDSTQGDRLVSMGVVSFCEGPVYRVAHVGDVVTEPDQRGKGYARMVVEAIVAYARAQRCTSVELTSADHRQPAIALYMSIGFEHKDTNVFVYNL